MTTKKQAARTAPKKNAPVSDAAKNASMKKIAANIALNEAQKAIVKEGKKVLPTKKVAAPKAKLVAVKKVPESADVKVVDELSKLFDKVEAHMKGKSAGTIQSAKSLLAKVCTKYHVTSITEDVAKVALEECGLAPRSKSNLAWSLKIGMACSKAASA